MCETAVVGERISRLRNKNNDCAVRREEEKGNEPPFRCGVHCRLAASLSFCKRVGAWKGGTSLNYRFTPKKKKRVWPLTECLRGLSLLRLNSISRQRNLISSFRPWKKKTWLLAHTQNITKIRKGGKKDNIRHTQEDTPTHKICILKWLFLCFLLLL